DRTGLSQSQVAQIAFGASGYLGISNKNVAGAKIQASADKSYQSSLSADQQKVLGALTNDQIAEFKQFGDRVSRDSSFINALGSDAREAKELSSRLATTTARSERADATYAERMAFAERLSTAREHGETISIDIAQDPHNVEMFMRYAEQYGGNSAAAFALFDAELARQGLRPNRFFSDGTALPASFDDVRSRHDHDATDARVNPDIATIDRAHRRQVSHFNTPVPGATEPTTASGIRNDIQAKGEEIRGQTDAAITDFDASAEIVKTPDGTLASKKSLFKQTGKQVAEDAGATIDNAKDAVKDLFKNIKK
ncbi:MAG TPA: conjugal transfer protein TraG, partial [Noviherbaspirillum sp.]